MAKRRSIYLVAIGWLAGATFSHAARGEFGYAVTCGIAAAVGFASLAHDPRRGPHQSGGR